ncbi:NAD-dependent epimerase/dehydratase family protein [Lacticaseibacillus paracasei]|uniref:NAD-dependent epimerase/dehydratase family protein n=1 Tax=Lacticaseibacillus paracasei TaxID=1597 RepID=UPI0025A2B9DA|nr:NAD-dependent epimerase/dehydratase family protein [Lacticaseibacillus paracasei]MDM7530363.1 NAD-dependent epimerase/dehydratase family protein [Lacticaseibacillus paracasei]MDM7542445.1 NAD-dependent epimerase/dehydratase family protein [Lacticaseibacillus paracasei]
MEATTLSSYLVTGGAGFIGANLTELLLTDPSNKVVIVDDLSMGLKRNIPKSDRVTFLEHSITDHDFMSKLLIDEHFDYIVLLAAIASVADSVERPYETHQVNQEANLSMLETLRVNKIPFKKLYFASSAAVYGDSPELPKKETMAVKPLTQYAVDKFATEREVLNYGRLYNMPVVCTRFFNVYGPKQNPKSPYSGVLSIMMDSLKDGKPFTFFGDGEQTRDFIYVGDVVRAIRGLVETPDARDDVFNVANGQQTTLNQVAAAIENLTGKKLDATHKAPRLGDIRDSYADASKIDQFDFMQHTSLSEGLAKYVASVQDKA